MGSYTTERFICDICGSEFITATDLEEHKQTHLRPTEEENVIRGDIGAAGLPTSPTP